jgi:nucleotide-binding universal stress UspA family protein
MKTILVATDFSDAARNASKYAVELAKKVKAKIIFFHAYHIPVTVSETPIMIDYPELEETNLELLKHERLMLDPENDLKIEYISIAGFAVDEILDLEKKDKPDLIVMGMSGAGKFSEVILGSVSTALIGKTSTPVLVVPENAQFKSIERIALACDYDIDPTSGVLEPLKKLAAVFNSSILIINLLKENEKVNTDKAIKGMMLENQLQEIEHTYHFPADDDFVHGLNDFADTHNIDILAIIPHKHNFLAKIFTESHTKKLAFHSHVPLFTIPETVK